MIFDTNIFVYADRGINSARDIIMSTQDRAISAVTFMEYIPFCRNKSELANFEKMLEALRFTVYEIDADISLTARQYTRQYALSHSVEMGDALIAATALKHGKILCTSNTRHFKPIVGLEINAYRPQKT